MINPLVEELASYTTVKTACDLLGRPRGSHYRAKAPQRVLPVGPRPAPPNALSDDERAQVLGVLTSDRFIDKSVAQTWATLLDEGGLPGDSRTRLLDLSGGHAGLLVAV